MARAGEQATPPVAAPRALRPLLGFTRLPARAVEAARRALDADDEFRARVAEDAVEGEIGRAAWLFLVRPEGWEQELAGHVAAAQTAEKEAAEEQVERSARHRLRGAEEAVRRAEEARAAALSELGRAQGELAAERRGRRVAEEEAARLRSRVAGLAAEVTSSRQRNEESAADAGRWRAEAPRLQAELERLHRELATAVSDLEDSRRAAGSAPPAPAASALPEVALADAAAAVADAVAAASRLGAALAAASTALGPAGRSRLQPEPELPAPATPDDGDGRRSVAHHSAATPSPLPDDRRRPPAHQERLPVPLPPATFEDAPEAARFLVRVPRLLLLVDGYNASLSAWPALAIADQRRRLVDALSELSDRTGVAVHVVFDGRDPAGYAQPVAGRRRVRLSFSPAEVDADDMILEAVDDCPADYPVAVASDDRRVQREARRRGANAIGIAQLFAVLGREG